MTLVGGLAGASTAEVLSWFDLGSAYLPLTGDVADSPVHWGKVAVSTTFWVVAPLLAGGVRTLRREAA